MMSSKICKRKISPIWPVAVSLAMMSLPCSSESQAVSAETNQPNVLLIFADDLGYADTGFQNLSQDVKTPNIDRLAEDGVIFKAGYVMLPRQFAVLHEQGVPSHIPTIGNYFQDAGYKTAIIGKWHDGDAQKFWPHNRGFDEFFGFNNGS